MLSTADFAFSSRGYRYLNGFGQKKFITRNPEKNPEEKRKGGEKEERRGEKEELKRGEGGEKY